VKIRLFAPTAAALKKIGIRPFYVVNRERYSHVNTLPAELLERLPHGFSGDVPVILATPAEIDGLHIPMARQRQAFLDGNAVMFVPVPLEGLDERDHGGQTAENLEKRARDGLRVTAALAVETMRACTEIREHKKLAPDIRRKDIIPSLQPYCAGLSAENTIKEGAVLLPNWFPGRSAHEVGTSAYACVANLPPARREEASLKVIENEQINLVRTAGIIYQKTLEFQRHKHAMSAVQRTIKMSPEYKMATPEVRADMLADALRERAPALHLELAHDKQSSPALEEFMVAAASMDCNPAIVFFNVAGQATELACAMLLGRVERGIGAWFDPMHIDKLHAFMKKADAADLKPEQMNPIDRAARRLRDLALRVHPRPRWDEFFDVATTAKVALWLPPAAGR
jgi:hypothetical protein